jgi:hypothetical protein
MVDKPLKTNGPGDWNPAAVSDLVLDSNSLNFVWCLEEPERPRLDPKSNLERVIVSRGSVLCARKPCLYRKPRAVEEASESRKLIE